MPPESRVGPAGQRLPAARRLCDNSSVLPRNTLRVAALFVIQGRNKGARFELSGQPLAVTIGRESSNYVRLDDHEVSRRHAEIRRVGDTLVLGDLKSSNGTFVNDRKVERAELAGGDRIRIGRTVLVYAKDHDDEQAIGLVDIVGGDEDGGGSRIIRSIREEDSIVLASPHEPQHHWLARARGNVQVMYRTSLAVSHTLDIDELLGRILHLVFEWIEADRGCIMLLDPETKELSTKARRDRRDGDPGPLTISRSILDYVLTNREGVLTSDAQDDDRFAAGNSVVHAGVREAICVPLRGRYDVVGVIYVDTMTPPTQSPEPGHGRFGDDHLKLMIAIAHQAALAVEDTTYYSAMVQSERLAGVGQTIATISHHIKNQLQGIRGGSYLVETGLDSGDLATVRKGWDIVNRTQTKISNLVMDMLSYGKDREPDPLPGDIDALVSDVVETVQQRATETGATIRWQPTGDLRHVVFDPEGLERALLNVVTNALDAVEGRQAPAVTIEAGIDRAAGMVRIVVTDNGPGIPTADLERIFNLFVSTKGERGTGIGLAVSRKILREHGGDIRATSRPGEGSSFIMEFPARFAEAAVEVTEPVDPPPDGKA